MHTRQALCCKMSVEYDKFIESGRKYVMATARCPRESPGLGPTHLGQGVEASTRTGPSLVSAPHLPQVVLPCG